MRHNPRQQSQVAGDNPAGRTRNRVRHSQDKSSDGPDMNTQPQAERPGTSRGTGPQCQSQSQPQSNLKPYAQEH